MEIDSIEGRLGDLETHLIAIAKELQMQNYLKVVELLNCHEGLYGEEDGKKLKEIQDKYENRPGYIGRMVE